MLRLYKYYIYRFKKIEKSNKITNAYRQYLHIIFYLKYSKVQLHLS